MDEKIGGYQPHEARPDDTHPWTLNHHARCSGNLVSSQLPDVVGEELGAGGRAYLRGGGCLPQAPLGGDGSIGLGDFGEFLYDHGNTVDLTYEA